MAFLIEREEAVEFHHLAGGAQFEIAPAHFGGDVDGGALQLGGLHLTGDGTVPNQFVKARLIAIDMFGDLRRRAAGAGRTYGFVRLLCILRLVVIFARRGRHVFLTVIAAEHCADVVDRFGRQIDAVGAHISDEADGLAVDFDALIESLREAHGVRRREAELAARLLLHGRRSERRRRIAPRRLGLDGGNFEGGRSRSHVKVFGLRAGADIEPLELLPVGADEARFESFPRGVANVAEIDQYSLATNFSISSSRSHTSRSATDCTRPAERAPGSLRQSTGESVKPTRVIERTAGEIGIDQSGVDDARMFHRIGHRLLGDGVKHHPFHGLLLERVLFLEYLKHMPGDRLTLAVGVGGQNELIGAFEGLGDVVEALVRLGVDLPDHAEVIIGVDRAVLGRQVADMAKRCQDLVAGAQVFIDRLRLGRRLDNDNIHENPIGYPPKSIRLRAESAACFGRNMVKASPSVK